MYNEDFEMCLRGKTVESMTYKDIVLCYWSRKGIIQWSNWIVEWVRKIEEKKK